MWKNVQSLQSRLEGLGKSPSIPRFILGSFRALLKRRKYCVVECLVFPKVTRVAWMNDIARWRGVEKYTGSDAEAAVVPMQALYKPINLLPGVVRGRPALWPYVTMTSMSQMVH